MAVVLYKFAKLGFLVTYQIQSKRQAFYIFKLFSVNAPSTKELKLF